MSHEALIAMALREDIGAGDVTTQAVVPPGQQGRAQLVMQEAGVVCGLEIARQVFTTVDGALGWETKINDGEAVPSGTAIAVVTGSLAAILSAERTALNFLQRLSGIATRTRHFVEAVAGCPVKLLDTRKTLPGWRALDKYAVAIGGGANHRFGLFDRYLVKSTHVDLAGSIAEAAARVQRGRDPQLLLEVEVRDVREVAEACAAGVDIIMLDNFTPEAVREAVALVAGRVPLEVSGGVTLANVRAYADTGVAYISIGALTHSVPAIEMHLRLCLGG